MSPRTANDELAEAVRGAMEVCRVSLADAAAMYQQAMVAAEEHYRLTMEAAYTKYAEEMRRQQSEENAAPAGDDAMRINRTRLRKQQLAIQAANRAKSNALQLAVGDLTEVVADFQAEVAAKIGGAPTVQTAVADLREKVAEVQAVAASSSDLVKVDPQPPVVSPQQAREIAADLVAEADAVEHKQ